MDREGHVQVGERGELSFLLSHFTSIFLSSAKASADQGEVVLVEGHAKAG